MGNETTILDVRAAQAVIEADRQERAEQAFKRIQEALAECKCDLVAFVIVGEQRIPVPVQVIAR